MVLSAATGTDVNNCSRQSKVYHKGTKVVDNRDDLTQPDGASRDVESKQDQGGEDNHA